MAARANEFRRTSIRRMFGAIAPRYDLLNVLLSMGQDSRWRRKSLRTLELQPGEVLLDLAAGTADVALEAARAQPELRLALALDFSEPMLLLARKKIEAAGAAVPILPAAADAVALPLHDAAADAVAIAFGIRNVVDVPAALAEMFRVLRPGGRLLILEFANPKGKLFGPVFRWYFKRVMPVLGGLISGSRAAYEYLPRSVDEFFEPEKLRGLMSDAGFYIRSVRRYCFGIVNAYTGEKQDERRSSREKQ